MSVERILGTRNDAKRIKLTQWEKYGERKGNFLQIGEFCVAFLVVDVVHIVFLEAKLLYNSVLSYPHSLTNSLTN